MSDYRALVGVRDQVPDRRTAGVPGMPGAAPPSRRPEAAAPAQADGLRWLMDALRRHVLLIALVVLGLDLAVFGLLMLKRPSYTATAEILIEQGERDFGNLRDQTGFSDNRVLPADMESELRVLVSRSMALAVIEQLDLRQVVEPKGVAGQIQEQLQGLAAKAWDMTAGIRQSFAAYLPAQTASSLAGPRGRFDSEDELEVQTEDAAIEKFQKAMEIKRDPLARVISVGYTSKDPELSARVVNAMTALYIEQRVASERDGLRQTASYLRDRLKVLGQELEDSERKVKAFQSKSNLFDVEGSSVAERRYGELSRELTASTVQLAEARSRLSQVAAAARTGKGLGSVREVATSPVIADLRRQESELARKVADLSTQYGQRHPQMLNAKAELEDVRRSIAAETDRVVTSLQNEVGVAEARISRLRTEAAEAEKRLSVSGTSQVELKDLERKAESTRKLYETMLDRYQRATEQQKVLNPAARIISAANPPTKPSDPPKILVLGFTTVAGLGLGAGLAFIRELRRRGFENSQDLEDAIGLPVLAVLPFLKAKGVATPGEVRASSAKQKAARAVYVESVQRVATRLLVGAGAQEVGRAKVVAVTSSFPAEGKTTLSLSVARQCARSGRRTLLIDGDLRRRTLERMLDLGGQRNGLVQLLNGQCDQLDEATVLDHLSDLRILPACGTPETPMQLLSSKAMVTLLADLRARYDIIIIDAPPILAVSDVLAVAENIDSVLFVVRWQRTPRDAVMAAIRELASADVDFDGLVLNAVDVRSYGRYGRPDHLYYASQYGDYYNVK